MYNTQEVTKLDPKSRKYRFLGYADGVKRYQLWDPTTYNVIISRDVIFAEDKLQEQEVKGTLANNSESLTIQVEQKSEQQNSFETIPEHEEQKPVEFETTEARRSTREKKTPT